METTTKIPAIELPETIGPHARVWIYQAERALSEAETDAINKLARTFTADWQAHGTNLIADHALLFGKFLALFVDETQHGASGCSIDASVRFVQAIEKEFNVSFMGRTQVAYLEGEELRTVEMNKLKELFNTGVVDMDTLVFNNLVASKSQMESSWILPISDSWHARLVS
jgi:hypothetical protein